MNPWLILALVVVFGGGIGYWFYSQTKQFREEAKDQCIVFMPTHGGDLRWKIVPIEGDEVSVPKDWGAKVKKGEKADVIKIGRSAMFNMPYPIGVGWPPDFMRATIKATICAEDSGLAWDPFASAPVIARDIINAIKKEQFIQNAIDTGFREHRRPEKSAVGQVKTSHLWILGVSLFIGLCAVGYVAYMAWQAIQANNSMWGV